MWTKENLKDLIRERMGDYLFIVVSNREPYTHMYKKGKIDCKRGPGGVVTALDPVMQACKGIWVAYGQGDADRKVCDNKGRIEVPPENPSYTLKRVWLSKEEENGYYYGFSNEALWPLCHMSFQRPIFRREDWYYYSRVNEKFADAILEEVGDKKAFVWIQDYHLTLLAQYLKNKLPNQLIVAQFWHIPWPNAEAFQICPEKHQILEGLLANDLLGFHIRYFCDNFFNTVDREIECKIDREKLAIVRGEHETLVRPYPISVDFEEISELTQTSEVIEMMESFKEEYSLSQFRLLIGVDRIDYTKGIPERLLALDRFLEKHPEFKEKIIFIQMGVLSRIHLPGYKNLNDQINKLVEEINWKHSTDQWAPIILMRRHLSRKELLALYRLAEVCIVSSVHDGMNLVAKEFVSSRSDEDGMLILSQFTGSARELTDAIFINPYDPEAFSDGIFHALSMPEKERQERMKKMRQVVQQNNIYRWAGKILSDLLKFEFKE